ncbi:BrnT family toxin [Bradyrhizobium sp. ORS 111]|uniref:BrnT family toxin n=1 Tax=Bradyrhizobium sp. ORS 111 TaxID=1685958 RepID=UPI00388F61E7
MKILWDEPKRLANLDKHGMDFADLNERFFDTALVRNAKRNRYQAIGVNMRGVISVVFAVYGAEAVSIVSMRAAGKAERDLYEEESRR